MMGREEGGENHMSNEIENPLLPKSSGRVTGTASAAQTLGNIIVSIVGTGVLGLPFAFRVAGWLAGCLGVMIAGLSTYYCMLLLVSISLLLHIFIFFLVNVSVCLFSRS